VSAHVVQWVTASPLWSGVLDKTDETERRQEMRKPALLRFERDSFMNDLGKLLESTPERLTDSVATPVTYKLPAPGETAPPVPDELKLYQAVHGHFYLVAATLACRMPGLPEHEVNASAKEKVAFVLRRIANGAGSGEYAWVDDPTATKGKSWKLLDSGSVGAVDPDEDLLPLFPVRYTSADDRLRRLYVGLVPTASGDAFASRAALAKVGDGTGAPPSDPRPAALTAKVTDPLRTLVENLLQNSSSHDGSILDASRFLLLDFAEFFYDWFGWFAGPTWTQPSRAADLALWNGLLAQPLVSGGATTWRQGLTTAWAERLILSGEASGASSLNFDLRQPGVSADQIDTAVAVLAAAVPYQADPSKPATTIQGDVLPAPPVPKLDGGSQSRYAIRCVYQRPECGPLRPDVVSEPSDPFKIAGFFDLDAPARSITITMPIHTNIRDLRKLKKNVSFLLSNELRSQMNRVTSLKDAMDGKFADGEQLDIGLLCSFSIPVITICALIVLMIFISLLNIVFWWMPFLRICFPIPLPADE
jgi:hypothetical protein